MPFGRSPFLLPEKKGTKETGPERLLFRFFVLLQGSAFKLPLVKHKITLFPFSFAHNRKSLKGDLKTPWIISGERRSLKG
ncbi:MAG: hypothetical protein AMK70_16420 [Nitrospira bacterium SG8_35_1]|nr:MAG: hypothetical protein AMK70_16420 [Nitrospira bacterium SG8_35_1]